MDLTIVLGIYFFLMVALIGVICIVDKLMYAVLGFSLVGWVERVFP